VAADEPAGVATVEADAAADVDAAADEDAADDDAAEDAAVDPDGLAEVEAGAVVAVADPPHALNTIARINNTVARTAVRRAIVPYPFLTVPDPLTCADYSVSPTRPYGSLHSIATTGSSIAPLVGATRCVARVGERSDCARLISHDS
jgi:hypothetical protein